jgi:mRNA-degrading endonuclease RelE of RelBE toxin-antitoxin system
MGYKLIYAAEVYNDLQENIDWYNQKQPSLGSRFFKAVKEQISRIKKNPYAIAVRYNNVRCAKVKRFPYLIHFEIFQDQNIIKVIAVFSTHRDPFIWEEKTNK